MANAKITQLAELEELTDDDIIPIVSDGTTQHVKLSTLKEYALEGVDLGGGGTGGATGTQHEHLFDTSTSANTVTVLGAGTAHTKGDWVDAIAATAFDAEILVVTLGNAAAAVNTTAADSSVLVDVGIHNGDSYDVFIADLAVGQSTAGKTYAFNVAIPQGTKLGLRLQGAQTSKSVPISLALRQAGSSVEAPTTVDTYGPDTGTSTGTVLTTASAAHTESEWTVLTAGTTAAYTKIVVALTAVANSTVQAANGAVDIGVYNGEDYDVIVSDIAYSTNTSEQLISAGNSLWYDVEIPEGAQVAARYRATSNNAAAKPNVAIYCS